MCVAIVIPVGEEVVLPTLAELEEMEKGNPHGAGLGWVEDGRCHWHKGLKAAEIHAALPFTPRPALVHFRFGTAGDKVPELTHPFPVASTCPVWLAGSAGALVIHNGHWHEWQSALKHASWVRKMPDGPWSDTRFIAFLLSRHVAKKVAAEIGNGSKLAILYDNGTVSTFGHWFTRGGVEYSNLQWSRPKVQSSAEEQAWKRRLTFETKLNAWKCEDGTYERYDAYAGRYRRVLENGEWAPETVKTVNTTPSGRGPNRHQRRKDAADAKVSQKAFNEIITEIMAEYKCGWNDAKEFYHAMMAELVDSDGTPTSIAAEVTEPVGGGS